MIYTHMNIYLWRERGGGSCKLQSFKSCDAYEADPSDCSISSSCSAIRMQVSDSKVSAVAPSPAGRGRGAVNASGVHWMSGVIPTWSMSCSDGDRYLATVMNNADPSCSSVTLWNASDGINRQKNSGRMKILRGNRLPES